VTTDGEFLSQTISRAKAKAAAAALGLVCVVGGLGAPALEAGAGGAPGAPPPDERAAIQAWAEQVFAAEPADEPAPPWLWVRRQDHGPFNRNKSVLDTPLQIGDRRFARGLGTHATSEIVIKLAAPAKEFSAQAGIDNNHDTKGQHGSAIFAVEADGKELFRSGICRGGGAPVPVKADLAGARRLVLRVLDAGDGPAHDQADWAEAMITMADGKQLFLDEVPAMGAELGLARQTPFSFVYGGKSSADLLAGWKRAEQKEPAGGGRELRVITCTDPATGLEVRCEVTLFKDYPAVDWVLRFTNTGKADSLMLEGVLPLDLGIGVPTGEVILHRAQGSTAGATDFLPIDEKLAPNAAVNLAPNGGRSSDGVLPFFNMEWPGGGLAWAVGWSGQWSQQVRRASPGRVEIRAGQQTFRARLRPGESVRTPRILLVSWQGADRMRGHNLLRRVILAHYAPRRDGELVMPTVSQNTWFLYAEGNGNTEENQLKHIRTMPALGVETYWLDAGWFEGGWPSGVGSWVPKADHFPRGLKPLGDEAHRLGLKFLVWFEPERVNPASRIAREHPEFVLGWKTEKQGDGLFNLGDPAARAWLTDHLSKCIGDWGIDIYRTDFNFPPLPFWQKADAPDRQGLTENHYVEGLYAMWDELRRRHPKVIFDDCASGGRRIDLEMVSRSYALSRSDSVAVKEASPAWDQAQTAGLSLYVPLHSTLSTCGMPRWSLQPLGPYQLRSSATSGFGLSQDNFAKDFPTDLIRKAIAEVRILRPLYNGDFYPLTAINVNEDVWCAWQFDRPEVGQGFAMFFRRPKAAPATFEAGLRGLEPKASYEVTFVDSARVEKLTGTELARLKVEIGTAPGSLLVTYRRLDR